MAERAGQAPRYIQIWVRYGGFENDHALSNLRFGGSLRPSRKGEDLKAFPYSHSKGRFHRRPCECCWLERSFPCGLRSFYVGRVTVSGSGWGPLLCTWSAELKELFQPSEIVCKICRLIYMYFRGKESMITFNS